MFAVFISLHKFSRAGIFWLEAWRQNQGVAKHMHILTRAIWKFRVVQKTSHGHANHERGLVRIFYLTFYGFIRALGVTKVLKILLSQGRYTNFLRKMRVLEATRHILAAQWKNFCRIFLEKYLIDENCLKMENFKKKCLTNVNFDISDKNLI